MQFFKRFKPTKPFKVDIIINDDLYLRRFNLIKLFGWTARLHKICLADGDRCLHTHPWAFYTICLWGGYDEETTEGVHVVRPLRGYWRPLKWTHRITKLHRTPTWTLVFTKGAEQPWGFMTTEGWKHHKEFAAQPDSTKVMWCDTGEKENEVLLP